MRMLMEYEQKALSAAPMGSWELLHEEVGFIGDLSLLDRKLIDLDGAETHLSHAMEGHAVQEERAHH